MFTLLLCYIPTRSGYRENIDNVWLPRVRTLVYFNFLLTCLHYSFVIFRQGLAATVGLNTFLFYIVLTCLY